MGVNYTVVGWNWPPGGASVIGVVSKGGGGLYKGWERVRGSSDCGL